MKKFLLSLALMLMGSFAFANTNVVETTEIDKIEVLKSKISSIEEINKTLNGFNLNVTELKYDDNKMVCGFTLSSDDGQGNAWSTWYDCTDMTMDDILAFILIFFFGF